MLETVTIQTGPFSVRLSSDIPSLLEQFNCLYDQSMIVSGRDFCDFHISLRRPLSIRRWLRPQVRFLFDGKTPFKPLPESQAMPMFEWGLNWCISNHIHTHLISHAAVVEKEGVTLILPGTPGSGKSTLSAALMLTGWRLLTDELAIIEPESLQLMSLCRPINLKNDSINLIKSAFSEAVFGDVVKDTTKGTVSLLRPDLFSFENREMPASPSVILFPRYQHGVKPEISPLGKGDALMQLAEQSFNYSLLAERGFDVLTSLVERCDCFSFTYGTLEDSIKGIDSIFAQQVGKEC